MAIPTSTKVKALAAALLMLVGVEGLSLKSYQDTGGVWTICYGYTHGVTKGQTASKEQCWTMLKSEAQAVMDKIAPDMPADMNPNQLAALTDFCYNVGLPTCKSSTLYKLARQGKYSLVGPQFLRWKYIGKLDCTIAANKCGGIPKRRQAEKALWEQAP